MRYNDPWAQVGDAALNAFLKYQMSKPSQAQNASLQADLDLKRSQADKYAAETALLKNRSQAPDSIAALFSDIYNKPMEAPRSDSNFIGAMPAVDPSNEVIQQRFNQNLPDIFANAMRYSSNNPSNLADVFLSIASSGGASPEQITNAQMGAKMDYADTLSGFQQSRNEPYTLNPGQIRFSPDNEQIASAPFKPEYVTDFSNIGQDNIQNNILPNNNSLSSNLNLYDKAGEVGGIKGGLAEIYANTLGQFLPVPDQITDMISDRQDMKTAQNDLIRSLSINKKYPVAEIKRILEENPVAPQLLLGGDAAQAKLRSLANSMMIFRDQAYQDANDFKLDENTRKESYNSGVAIDRFLQKLNVPMQQDNNQNIQDNRPSLDDIFGR